MTVQHRRHRLGPEESLPPERLRAEGLACERLQLAAQPRGRRNREAALLAADDLLGNERCDRLAQQHLLAQAANAVLRWEGRGEAGERGVEERHACLERV